MKQHRISGGFEPTPNPCSYRLSIEESGFPAGSAFDFTSSVTETESPLAQVLFRHFPLETGIYFRPFYYPYAPSQGGFLVFFFLFIALHHPLFCGSGQILGKALEKKVSEKRRRKRFGRSKAARLRRPYGRF